MNILVVENDDFFREAVTLILESHKFKVDEAQDGKAGRELVALKKYDIVISDIQMPYMNGIELLKWIKENKKEVPVILMTGFSHLLETQNAFELGADEFLNKPFTEGELLKAIRSVVKDEEGNKAEVHRDEEFCKIPIRDFISATRLEHDIYIRLSDQKYVKVANQGDSLYKSRITHYREKGLNHLYVTKKDFNRIVGFNVQVGKLVANSDKLKKEKKVKFFETTGEIILEKAFVLGTDQETFDLASDFVKTNLNVITDIDPVFSLLDILNRHSDHLYAHSLGVSIYSTIIAEKVGWTSMSTKSKVALAGLFHDIGKKEINREIIEKSRSEMTPDEIEMVETHPRRGKEILDLLRIFPPDISEIVLEHHENCIGLGYPRRLKKNKIHPLARLVSVANVFCNYTINNPNSIGMDAITAVQQMEMLDQDALDPELFLALKMAIKPV